jgi:hypothetical protein
VLGNFLTTTCEKEAKVFALKAKNVSSSILILFPSFSSSQNKLEEELARIISTKEREIRREVAEEHAAGDRSKDEKIAELELKIKRQVTTIIPDPPSPPFPLSSELLCDSENNLHSGSSWLLLVSCNGAKSRRSGSPQLLSSSLTLLPISSSLRRDC